MMRAEYRGGARRKALLRHRRPRGYGGPVPSTPEHGRRNGVACMHFTAYTDRVSSFEVVTG
eukprot:2293465-Rhodomonas_salina.5